MGSFPSLPKGTILKGSGGTEMTTLPISIWFLALCRSCYAVL